jgi:hypothetical protein
MRMGNGKPKLFKYVYASEHVINEITLLAEGEELQLFQSTEQAFRKFAEVHRSLMPGALLKQARFYPGTLRRLGCYWNRSYLFIPMEGTPNYYKVGYFS